MRKSGRRLAAGVALVALVPALAACGSSSSSNNSNKASSSLGTVLYGTLPPVGTPVHGGTITQGQLTGQTPTYILPIVSGANITTGTLSFSTELYMPLFEGPLGARPQINYGASAAAGAPTFSNGDKTLTVTLKPGLKWSDGKPITSTDVLFWYDLLKAAIKESPANWAQYTPGLIPDNVTSVSTPSANKIVFNLNRSWNPGFFLNNNLQDTNGGAYPLPSSDWNIASAGGPHITDWATNPADAKKIYDYLNKQGASVSTFASNPLWKVVSGPFKLQSFSATNSSYVLTPNPNYGGTPKAIMNQVDVNTYTDFTSELNAVKSGSLDVMVGLDPSQLPQAASLKAQGIDVYGGPGWGWFGGQYNFKDTANHFDKLVAQPYFRQVMAYLTDQPAIIKGVYKNAAVAAYGPVPSAPTSPYAPADAATSPYPYNPAKAVSILKSHGWNVVPNGQTTCKTAGNGGNTCGPGIPAGTPISFVWANQPESVSSVGALESEVVASEAKQAAGINITLQTKTFNFLTTNYNNANPAAAKYTNDWGVNNYGGIFTDFYPSGAGIWNPGGGLNIGGVNDPMGNQLIDASEHSGDVDAAKNEAAYWTKNPPVDFMPDQDYLLAVNSKKVAGPSDGWTVLTQQQWQPQYWYIVK
ncbi:MAG TPA: ABC transporter substrate-binding protein [Solirubrobacteraceae bacterium]|nr:ABC transporter substrate-binding protein [Solirubrobacteraceae bacterium]